VGVTLTALANRGFSCHRKQFLQRRVDTGNGAQRGERATVGGMDVLLFIEMRELLVRRGGESQAATAAACLAGVGPDLVALAAVAATD
jgi:hypothetical protein